MDVMGDGAFAGHAGGFFLCDRGAAFAEDHDRLFHVALSFGESVLTIHHGRSGAVAEFLHMGSRDIWTFVVVWFRSNCACHNR